MKDRTTIPYMTEREIPAIKLALSAWRMSRKDRDWCRHIRELSECADKAMLATLAETTSGAAAWHLELLSQAEERMWKEDK